MFSRAVELVRGPRAALLREMSGTPRFQELATKLGKNFPWQNYDRAFWPLPYYQLVSREDALGHCPNCGSCQQIGPREFFPETYHCGACGFSGKHPLYYRQKEELQTKFHLTPRLHGDLPAGLHNN